MIVLTYRDLEEAHSGLRDQISGIMGRSFVWCNTWDCTSTSPSCTCHDIPFQLMEGGRRRCVWSGIKDSRIMLYFEGLSSDVVSC